MGVEILVHQSVITFSLEVLFINMTPDYVVTDRFYCMHNVLRIGYV